MVALRDTGLVDLTDGCERISQLKERNDAAGLQQRKEPGNMAAQRIVNLRASTNKTLTGFSALILQGP